MNTTALIQAMNDLLDSLPEEVDSTTLSTISKPRRKQLRELIRRLITRLESTAAGLDPVQDPKVVFDPADPAIVGRLIGETLLEQPRCPLGSIGRFYGSGVYALYFTGTFPAYQPISGTESPIYVGKADPASPNAKSPREQGERLYGRLSGDHAKSIAQAEAYALANGFSPTITLSNFECRFLVVRSAWQRTAEQYLINMFKPVWNDEVGICYGFGKHGDDPKTRSNTRSPWDTIHPGRPWATREGNLENPLSDQQIELKILAHLSSHSPTASRRRE